jgi:hypothetical protein
MRLLQEPLFRFLIIDALTDRSGHIATSDKANPSVRSKHKKHRLKS